MIKIRKYHKNDNEAIGAIRGLMSLELMWHGGFKEENAFVAVDENGEVVGATALSFDATWYYIDKSESNIDEYKLQFETAVKQGIEDEVPAYIALISRLKKRLMEIKKNYPDKKISMRCFVDEGKHDELEFMLNMGLSIKQVIMVLQYDLTKSIETTKLPRGYKIGLLEIRDGRMDDYLRANKDGYDGVQDSADELWFRLCVPSTQVIAVEKNNEVVSSVTVFDIEAKHSTTENVFTVPAHRQRGLASAAITYALNYLKEQGQEEATLTVLGDNQRAFNLYLSLGYTVKYCMYELRYTL